MTRDQIITRAMANGRLDPRKLDWAQVAPIGSVIAEIVKHEPGAFHGVKHTSRDVREIAKLSGHNPAKLAAVINNPVRSEADAYDSMPVTPLEQIAKLGGHSIAALQRNAARLARLEAEEQGKGGDVVPSIEGDPGSDGDDGDEGDELTPAELDACEKFGVEPEAFKAAKHALAKMEAEEGDEDGAL